MPYGHCYSYYQQPSRPFEFKVLCWTAYYDFNAGKLKIVHLDIKKEVLAFKDCCDVKIVLPNLSMRTAASFEWSIDVGFAKSSDAHTFIFHSRDPNHNQKNRSPFNCVISQTYKYAINFNILVLNSQCVFHLILAIYHEELVLSGLLRQKLDSNIYRLHAQ